MLAIIVISDFALHYAIYPLGMKARFSADKFFTWKQSYLRYTRYALYSVCSVEFSKINSQSDHVPHSGTKTRTGLQYLSTWDRRSFFSFSGFMSRISRILRSTIFSKFCLRVINSYTVSLSKFSSKLMQWAYSVRSFSQNKSVTVVRSRELRIQPLPPDQRYILNLEVNL
jgi:hypothetical protein